MDAIGGADQPDAVEAALGAGGAIGHHVAVAAPRRFRQRENLLPAGARVGDAFPDDVIFLAAAPFMQTQLGQRPDQPVFGLRISDCCFRAFIAFGPAEGSLIPEPEQAGVRVARHRHVTTLARDDRINRVLDGLMRDAQHLLGPLLHGPAVVHDGVVDEELRLRADLHRLVRQLRRLRRGPERRGAVKISQADAIGRKCGGGGEEASATSEYLHGNRG